MKLKNKVLLAVLMMTLIFSTGVNKSFSQVMDIDGNVYKTVKIVTQEWMAEDLNSVKKVEGDSLTVSDIIEVLVNLWSWDMTGKDCWFNPLHFGGFEKAGENSVKVLRQLLYGRKPDRYYQTLEITGPKLKFYYDYDNSHDNYNLAVEEIEIEVISKTHVKMKETSTAIRTGNVYYYSSEWKKKK